RVAVIGAGAAGLMAAIFASRQGADTLLLERTKDGGRKILISGGGRCNVLPATLEPSRFVTASSPHTLRKILLSWPLSEQRRFFEEDLGIPLVLEPETNKLFPLSNRARDVRDALIAACRRQGVECRFAVTVSALNPPSASDLWGARLGSGETISARAVVMATGGLSVPSTGSDGTGMAIAAQLGHTIHSTYPALTPLTADPPRHSALAGVSLNVRLESLGEGNRLATTGGFLFTHRGYSGPAVLDLSHRAVLSRLRGGPREILRVNWCDLPEAAWEKILREGTGRVGTLLRNRLPERLAAVLLTEARVDPSTSLSQLRREERKRLLEVLVRYNLPWTSDEGYRKGEVTGGGVALEEVHPRTLESRRHPGLFLCGEMLDCFGPIGGHNFVWAWATGRSAGTGAARKVGARMAAP
ncbi:MAG: aminoacetone oxidase family FAD-binding enzyme, partial [Acidobacteria bacterium]|nr:aminoacetone oxidase family FAD-binding enzyme [Acidobacteriota bacterium]